MHISTALFLQTHGAQSDKKVSKEAVAKVLAGGVEPPSVTPPQTKNIQDVVTQLMGTLVLEAKSKGAVLEFLHQSPVFKNLGNFQQEIKSLITLLKNDTTFQKPLLLLQNFHKDMEHVDAKTLKAQVKHSGLFFESTLANTLSKTNLQETLKSLHIDLKEHLAQTNKTPSLTKEITPLLEYIANAKQLSPHELQTTLKATLALVRQSAKEHLAFEPPALLKASYSAAAKIETMVEQVPLMASKVSNSNEPLPIIQNLTREIKELLAILKADLISQIPKEALLKIEPQLATFKPSSPNELLETLKADLTAHTPQEALSQILPQIETLMHEPTLIASVSASMQGDMSLEETLSMLANRIKQSIALFDPQTPKLVHYTEKSAQLEHKIASLVAPERFIAPEIMQKLSINPANAEILGDMKGILTSLSDKLTASTTPNAAQALETTQKLLTQIEYHQLVSYVGSATHVYIPFTWNGLKEGSMMMKQTKEDAFHCQIDLDLEQYGKLNMMLFLSGENYLDMTIATQKNELGVKVNEHLSTLKKALNDVGIITQSVRLMEYKEAGVGKKEYFADDSLNFGINITI